MIDVSALIIIKNGHLRETLGDLAPTRLCSIYGSEDKN